MLSIATPWVLGAAALATALVGALHLLSVRRPPPLLLPTARFVPDGEARSVARQPRPNDLLLLALRVTALLCAGLALSGVRWTPTRVATVRRVVAERQWQRDSSRWLAPDGADRVDLVWQDHLRDDPGVALVAATQAAAVRVQREPGIERFDLMVVLPPSVRSLQGWDAWRAQWPGRVRVQFSDTLHTVRETWPAPAVFVQTDGRRDDVVAAAFSGARRTASGTAGAYAVRVERGDLRDTVSVAPVTAATVVLHWPRSGRPDGWAVRMPADTAGAVVAMGQVLVGPWERTARLPAGWDTDSLVQPVAWWSDGEVAVVERPDKDGCVREVAIAVPERSDLLLSAPAAGLRRALTAPCGGVTVRTARLARDDTAPSVRDLAPASAFRGGARQSAGTEPWWLGPVLLGVAATALLVEWVLRRHAAAS
ncbi:MAG: hypothetical protein ACK5W7_18170 [Gemmatimonadaceae bacterium]